eukprot:TRINITY_DN83592_c0_g1_i1.p1 TRINITY_DN83592_c0_g1~~TRINITY_DN83592_c0_g1_i1.p1  ORF type:complete len:248 (-),score=51.91 TRINITY_DN83592_c0_g1_i1:43-786(-)
MGKRALQGFAWPTRNIWSLCCISSLKLAAAYESPLRYYVIVDEKADIRDLELGDLDDMEVDVPRPFLEHLREVKAQRSMPKDFSPDAAAEAFEKDPGKYASNNLGTLMTIASMTLSWTEAHGREGTDKLAEVWATMLEMAGLRVRCFAVQTGQVLFATESRSEADQLKSFALSQPDVDFFEVNQERFFPPGRNEPLATNKERKETLARMQGKPPEPAPRKPASSPHRRGKGAILEQREKVERHDHQY